MKLYKYLYPYRKRPLKRIYIKDQSQTSEHQIRRNYCLIANDLVLGNRIMVIERIRNDKIKISLYKLPEYKIDNIANNFHDYYDQEIKCFVIPKNCFHEIIGKTNPIEVKILSKVCILNNHRKLRSEKYIDLYTINKS